MNLSSNLRYYIKFLLSYILLCIDRISDITHVRGAGVQECIGFSIMYRVFNNVSDVQKCIGCAKMSIDDILHIVDIDILNKAQKAFIAQW